MSFDHKRIINCPGAANDGKTVWVDFERRGYSPIDDIYDERWVSALLGDDPQNGKVGWIEKKYLDLQASEDLGGESMIYEKDEKADAYLVECTLIFKGVCLNLEDAKAWAEHLKRDVSISALGRQPEEVKISTVPLRK